jgi:hypothetical protein
LSHPRDSEDVEKNEVDETPEKWYRSKIPMNAVMGSQVIGYTDYDVFSSQHEGVQQVEITDYQVRP